MFLSGRATCQLFVNGVNPVRTGDSYNHRIHLSVELLTRNIKLYIGSILNIAVVVEAQKAKASTKKDMITQCDGCGFVDGLISYWASKET